jgi:iron(II)-dependent oxidoreductase
MTKAPSPNPQILAALGSLHEMLRELLRGLSEADARQPYDPRLGCPSWQFAHAVYQETYWLREVIAGDQDLTARIRHLFPGSGLEAPPGPALTDACGQLPPPAHLIRWGAEIQDEHLRRLSTPGALPGHPLLADDRLPWFILQENARVFERLLALLGLRALARPSPPYQVERVLEPGAPVPDLVAVNQGHYRIGARGDPFAYDHELPPQAVELSAYRIARRPVTNAAFLGFMAGGGYARADWWDAAGWAWLNGLTPRPRAPLGWRQDDAGHWFGMNLNGPADLVPDQPVSGISRHEARAFSAWTSDLGGDHRGAVVQHEYQWEVAARSGLIEGTGRAWEWCANPFHPYPGFSPFPDPYSSQTAFDRPDGVLRGTCLHTQRCLRRASARFPEAPDARWGFAGTRLVYPP